MIVSSDLWKAWRAEAAAERTEGALGFGGSGAGAGVGGGASAGLDIGGRPMR